MGFVAEAVVVSVVVAHEPHSMGGSGFCGILVDVEPPLAVVTLLRAVVEVEF